MASFSRTRVGGISYRNAGVFWLGVACVTAGVALHLPMFIDSADMHYMLAGMGADAGMIVGMTLIVTGFLLTAYGVTPRRSELNLDRVAKVRVRALDDARIKPVHVGLLVVMAFAVTIDVMKPVTLGFVVPGMAKEYGLKSALHPQGSVPVALFPFCALVGLALGSFAWASLGDRIGRRASILLAGVLFAGTAICGTMPAYYLNFLMCFLMGIGVGGMLPIAFTLIAETMPARHRGWLMVMIGGDVAGAYIVVSWLSSALTPHFGWRILWLFGLPTALLLIALNRFIPESPRFLIATGRDTEAREVLRRYGAEIAEADTSELAIEKRVGTRWRQLLAPRFRWVTMAIVMFGIGVGLVTFGFQLWIPTNLQKLGFNEATSDRILRDSALIGFPLTLLIAWMYGFWSSRKTLIVLGLATAAALGAFVVMGDGVVHHRVLLYALLVLPITGISSVLAALAAYSAEIYPTKVRARGTGVAMGASKAGGVLVAGLVAAAFAAPSIAVTALIGAIPMLLATVAMAVVGIETRKRSLEAITAEELQISPDDITITADSAAEGLATSG